MGLKVTIEDAARHALKNQEPLLLSTLRLLLAAIHNREIEKKTKTGDGELSEEETLGVLRTEAKKRRDAIAEYQKAGRAELAEKESLELRILEVYLPPELSEADLERAVQEAIEQAGAVSAKDTGRLIGEVMRQTGGRAGGERVSVAVRKAIGVS